MCYCTDWSPLWFNNPLAVVFLTEWTGGGTAVDHSDDTSIPDSCKPDFCRGRIGSGFKIAARLEKNTRYFTCSYPALSLLLRKRVGPASSSDPKHPSGVRLCSLCNLSTDIQLHLLLAAPASTTGWNVWFTHVLLVRSLKSRTHLICFDFTVLLFTSFTNLSINLDLDPLCNRIDWHSRNIPACIHSR